MACSLSTMVFYLNEYKQFPPCNYVLDLFLVSYQNKKIETLY